VSAVIDDLVSANGPGAPGIVVKVALAGTVPAGSMTLKTTTESGGSSFC
jgi:hypothetical protein